MSSKKKSLSKIGSKMFRKRSRSTGNTRRQTSRERIKAEQFMNEFDISNVCNHLEALMNCARYGNSDLLYKLYIHHVDLKMTDETGNTAMHVAVMNGHQKIVRMLVVLCSPHKIWKVKNNSQLTALELCTDELIHKDLMSLEYGEKQDEFKSVDETFNDTLVDAKTSWEKNERFLVSLDGGGIRAVITIQMLLHIDEMLDGKLVDKIDDIAGTSCGGIISLLLSSRNRNFEETRKLLLDMRERVFCRNAGRVVWPKYNASGIEYVAKHITAWEDQTMSIIPRIRTIVTVSDTRMVPPQLLLFRSYIPDMPEEAREHYKFFDPAKVELWKALRCTTAAPFFFESFNGLSDGGLIANNPTLALISDFLLTNKLEKIYAKNSRERETKGNWKIGCVLSLGTGIFPTEKIDGIDLSFPTAKNPFQMAKSFYKAIGNTKNMLNMLVKECTASNGQPVKYAREWCHSINVPYFRFSPHLSQGIALDEIDLNKIMQVMWETEVYVAENHSELLKLVDLLKRKPPQSSGKVEFVKTPPAETWNVDTSSRRTSVTTKTEED